MKMIRLRCVLLVLASLFLAPAAWSSIFYKFDVVAYPGQHDLFGNVLTAVSSESASINDLGNVAFVGMSAAGSAIYLKTVTAADINVVSFQPSSSRRYANGIRLNNTNQITAEDQVPGPISLVRIWDGNNPGLFTDISRGEFATDPTDPVYSLTDFDGVFSYPSGNNQGQVVFSAIGTHAPFKFSGSCANECLVTKSAANSATAFTIRSVATPVRPALADDGTVIFRDGSTVTSPIRVTSYDFATSAALTDATFTEAGRSPGISNDGQIAVFAGNRGQGRGVFMRLKSGAAWGPIIRLAGENSPACTTPELGYDAAGARLCFNDVDVDSKVAVTHMPLGDAGLRDDSLVVSFSATPNHASRDNPQVAGKPLVFSANKGLWTLRVDLERPLTQAAGFEAHATSPIPVVQIGDTIQTPNGAKVVSGFDTVDPLAAAANDDAGVVRTQRRGDHRMAFWVNTAANENFVIRASHLNSSQDGLLDHWKTAGGGLDIDQDGSVDLDLSKLGATVGSRHLFIEIDWTADRVAGVTKPYTHKLLNGVTATVAAMFANAPALKGSLYGVRSDGAAPADIPAGITAHIDAGPGNDLLGNALSQNIPAAAPPLSLQGGDSIAMFNGGPPPDLLYLGLRNSVNVPGLNARSLDEIKDVFFSTHDKGARELAFHYIVLTDFYSLLDNTSNADNANPFVGAIATIDAAGTTLTANGVNLTGARGNGILLTSGAGAGQLRMMSATTANSLTTSQAWATRPAVGDRFVMLSGSSGVSEADWRAVGFAPFPGNDVLVSLGGLSARVTPTAAGNYLGNPFITSQTIAHEIGHNFGLRHGGTDHANFKPTYTSLMNYLWQLSPCSSAQGCVTTYGLANDAVFADWLNLRMDFSSTAPFIGNSFSLSASGALATAKPPPEPTWDTFESQVGPFDLQPPFVNVVTPAANATLPLGQPLTVTLTAVDNVRVASVSVSFDLNGDGLLQATETVPATLVSGNTYSATFAGVVSGAASLRLIRVRAFDTAGNAGEVQVSVSVGQSTQVSVPNVVGQTSAAAQASIVASGLKVGTVTQAPSSTVAAGSVISQNPAAGVTVAPGSAVNLVVSSGPAPVSTPNVVGQTQAAAQSAIVAAGLKLGTVTLQPSSTVASGLVISQNPAGGVAVAAGSTVNLVVSSGPAPVSTPNVVGQTQAAAQSAIVAAGLKLGTVTLQPSSTVASGLVISQTPAAGVAVATGSTVNLVVSSGPAAVSTPNVVGQTQAAAQSAIVAAGLKLGTVTLQPSSTVASGLVISQSPAAGSKVTPASSVNLVVSSGPLAGDVNGDGAVNCADVSVVKLAFGSRLGQARFDVRADTNNDGLIDVRDLAFVTQRLPAGTTCP